MDAPRSEIPRPHKSEPRSECGGRRADVAGKPAAGKTGKLPLRVKLAIGIGEAVQGMYITIAGYYLNAFFLETACIDPMYVGVMQALQGIFDAVNDPIIGSLSDRTRTRWGRRRPWLLFAAPCLAACYFLLWNALPTSTPHTLRFLYSLCTYMGVSVGITAIQVQIGALVPELTDDYDERTSISGYRVGIMAAMGLAAAMVHTFVVGLYDGSATGFRISALLVALVMWGTAWLTFMCVRETWTPQQESPERLGVAESVRTLLNNKAYMCVTGAYLCGPTAVVMLQSNLLMFCKYILNDTSVIQKIIPIVQISGLISLPVWVIMGQFYDKRLVYMVAGTILATAAGSMFFIAQEIEILILACIAGICLPVPYLVPYSLLPDVIDEDELHTGKRREGLFVGFFTVCLKLSVTGSLTLTNLSLKVMGYEAPVATCGGEMDMDAIMLDEETDSQSESALFTIRLLCSFVPATFVLLATMLVWRFPITREKQAANAKLAAQLREERCGRAQSEKAASSSAGVAPADGSGALSIEPASHAPGAECAAAPKAAFIATDDIDEDPWAWR